MTTQTLEQPQPAALPVPLWECSWHGCPQPAAFSIRFRNQPGHVHDCAPHTAILREWNDVAESINLAAAECPWIHGVTWTDQPNDLT